MAQAASPRWAAKEFFYEAKFNERRDKRKALRREAIWFTVFAALFQIAIFVLFAIFTKYMDPRPGPALGEPSKAEEDVVSYWNYTRDVSIMIFFGFGYLMTFLRRNGYSAVGYTLFTSALVVQWSILCQIVAETDTPFAHRHPVGVYEILNGLFCAASVMISFGGVLGKVTPLMMLVLAFIEPMFYWLNLYIGLHKLKVFDIGGGMFIHVFGCYFGMVLTWFCTSSRTREHPDNVTNYTSDLLSLAGTIFLWIMWPSFNAAIALPQEQTVAIVNTFLALCGSTIATFLVSRIVSHWKLEAVHVQNSSLAGGVVMGVAAHLPFNPATAIGVGFFSGAVSVLGYNFLTPFLTRTFGLQDICGIHNLHGMPGLIGSFVGVFAGIYYGRESDMFDGLRGRQQGLYQFIEICVSLGLALVGGLIAGGLLWLIMKFIYPLWSEDYYNDRAFWAVPGDYPVVVRRDENEMTTYLRAHGEEIMDSDLEPQAEIPTEKKLKRGPTRAEMLKM